MIRYTNSIYTLSISSATQGGYRPWWAFYLCLYFFGIFRGVILLYLYLQSKVHCVISISLSNVKHILIPIGSASRQVSSCCLPKKRHCHTCQIFPHCLFSSLGCSPGRVQSHIGSFCLTFLQCVSSNASSNCLPDMMHIHIGCIGLTFLHCAFSNVSSNCLLDKRHSHVGCICLTFPTVWRSFPPVRQACASSIFQSS